MTTTAAPYDARFHGDSDSRWLGWVSLCFLGLNLLLMIVVVYLWRYRPPAGMGVAEEATSPVVSLMQAGTKAESIPSAPSTPSQSLSTAQETTGLETGPIMSETGSEEHPSAVAPSAATSDTGSPVSSVLMEGKGRDHRAGGLNP